MVDFGVFDFVFAGLIGLVFWILVVILSCADCLLVVAVFACLLVFVYLAVDVCFSLCL